MIESIRVDMLGGLSVWADGVPVLDSSAKINKPWQVFCFLVLNRNAPTAPARLIAALWPDENLSDPGNVLKNTVYALRREFKMVSNTSESPILFEHGGYVCNPAIDFDVDVEKFEKLCQQVSEVDSTRKTKLLSEAAELYKGELLPQLDSEIWIMPLSVYYKKRYGECIQILCSRLEEEKEYSRLLEVATAANQVDPLEEKYYLYMFRALYALEMHRVIIPTYHKVSRLFAEEMGVPLCEEITEIYKAASEQVDQIEQDIMIIKDDLREIALDSVPIKGPLYCTYDVFKYLYQMVARSSERTGGRIIIVLLTLQSKDEVPPSAKVLSAAMNQIKSLILGGLLRKSDTVARYSKSQYIVMLSIEKAGGAESVMNRIRKQCEVFLEPNGLKIVFATAEIDPLLG